ncbi:MAG TPA: microcin ABC transporter permease, partial [Stellaceae bacterium]|nr:microcin ABC transporter permease [Stellaceae bacterium]
MLAYALRRILLMIPTLFAIILVNFVIVQAAPGGPVDQLIAQLKGTAGGSLQRVSGGGGELAGNAGATSQTRGARGLDPAFIAQLNKLYGFDKPAPERFWLMLKNYLRFDFGDSFYQDRPVIQIIASKLPVSISLGL